jgi:hypothetical protein
MGYADSSNITVYGDPADYEANLDLLEFVEGEVERLQNAFDQIESEGQGEAGLVKSGGENRPSSVQVPEFTWDTTLETSSKPDVSASQSENWDLMVGKWYGSHRLEGGGILKTIAERSPRGKYQITFRTYDEQGNYQESIEPGYWGISGPVYFTIFRGVMNGDTVTAVDPANPYKYDAYSILSLNADVFEYQSFSSGDKSTERKVPADFEFVD